MTHFALEGCVLGTAVGDALGLPYEGLSPQRAAKWLGPPNRHRLVFGRGLVSDDTEHTCMVAQALIEAASDVDAFQRGLARRFRGWLLTLPAGVGFATLRAIVRLWLGYGPNRSGVFSAGNGPAMRAAILGVFCEDRDQLRLLVRASTRLTHTDPKAEYGAYAVALAAQIASTKLNASPEHYLQELSKSWGDEARELIDLISRAADSAAASKSTPTFACELGLSRGVSGYVYHSVPVALHAWFAHSRDYRAAVTSVIACGGDADTTAAIVGGILGAAVGRDGIPQEWLNAVGDWPRSISWMEQLAVQLSIVKELGTAEHAPRLPIAGVIVRNIVFLLIVLYHGFRRLLPPY